MQLHDVRVHPSKSELAREDQLAWRIAAVAAAGKLGQMNAEPIRDVYRQDLPERPLVAADIETVKFAVTFRGYAMAQVDDLLERLGREIDDRDRRIAELSRLESEPPAP